ncbi:MAG: S8 family serine peptidase [Chitinophagaceae bacterium]|nr:S8 family serine peptidase [Chitinophagaceae bacterium]
MEFLQAAPAKDQPLNDKSRANGRGNVLQSTISGGRGLTGEGVVIGVGDDGTPTQHIDLIGRAYNHSSATSGPHGIHVMGTIAGAGIRDERYKGFAYRSRFVAQIFSNILFYTPIFIADYGMVITNNSYGNIVDDCESFGVYDLYSRMVDQQMNQYPFLMHVFAAGNSGLMSCGSYPDGFGNVLGAYQSAKNSISVGNTWETTEIAAGSSKGPVKDGRIKPEITAQGTRVTSTVISNSYGRNSGTSMAAPAVSGGLALLYERYKQLNGNLNPSAALMKAVLCNGATDLGAEGPDFTYGFGWMNLLRSVKMLEATNYFQGQITQGAQTSHSIIIPAGEPVGQLKIMLHWNDPAAMPLAAETLQHDLDLEVSGPGGTILPYVLNTNPIDITQPATRGVDRINNIEQVVINNPQPGAYQVKVRGHRITSSQDYVVVYDILENGMDLTYPLGGEKFSGSDSLYVSWDWMGTQNGNLRLEYSIDNGNNWELISNSVAPSLKQYLWHIPAGISSEAARIRVTQPSTSLEKVSEDFVIIGVPVVSLASVQCDTYIAINWTAVPDATDYEVMISSGEDMRSVVVTNGLSYTIGGLNRDSLYFVTVRARINGKAGLRALAISRTPATGTCAGSISNGDFRALSISAPATSGRLETSRQLSATTTVRFFVRNIDDVSFTGPIPVGYRVNDGPVVSSVIPNITLGAGGSVNYTFPVTANFAAPGTYILKAWVDHPNDPQRGNDTATAVIKQVVNPEMLLPYVEDFENMPIQSHTTRQTGLEGLDKFDFVGSTTNGRLRSFVSSGHAYSGDRAITLDVERYTGNGNVDSLTGNFNLKNYSTATHDVRLDFQYMHHGQQANAANRVWVRGNDQNPWLLIYDLDADRNEPGVYRKTPSLEVSDLLQANGQDFSSSFQVKWGQWGRLNASDRKSGSGYTIDDVRLYYVTDDIQLISIENPITASCGLNTSTPVRVVVRNSANGVINNIPVSYRVNGQNITTEIIPAIPANTAITYTFNQGANMSGFGSYKLETWVSLATDDFQDNDTARVVLQNSPVINQFPYLQDFETGENYWFADGKNSSWEFGTPASVKIKTAASGNNAWKTTLSGNYNDLEHSYLYSPCFDISGMTSPILSFSTALDIEDCGTALCDGAWVEYSTDGINWNILGNRGEGKNWYDKNFSTGHVWAVQNYTNWHVASIPLPTGYNNLRIRFVMKSDPYVSREGIAVDDIHIFDLQSKIFETSAASGDKIELPVSGNNWVEFRQGNEVVAAIHPRQQDLGNTSAQAYLNKDDVRSYNNAYYLDRNIVVQSSLVRLSDSVDVRFYFTDKEVEQLRSANGCANCPKVVSAYTLGISQYTDNMKAHENGTVDDNTGTNWQWVPPGSVRIVPYDSGYYAAFRVNRFSEFWLSAAPLGESPAPSVVLGLFTATKRANNEVAVDWRTDQEYNMDYYEVEVARGNDAYTGNEFEVLSHTASSGNSGTATDYQYVDTEPGKTGVRYYRLKMVDFDGGVSYSEVRAVYISSEMQWQVYPNPTTGASWIVFQSEAGEKIQVVVYDINGKRVLQKDFIATGFVQKMDFDLSGIAGSGMYLVEAIGSRERKVFKLVKR